MSAFTPGPWEAVEWKANRSHRYVNVRVRGGNDVARLYARNQYANAHLIAAAPRLYKALAESKCHGCNVFIGEPTVADCGMCRTKRAALAAARGEAL